MTDITFRRNPTAALYRVLVERFPFGDHEPKTANEADLRAAGYVPALEADTVSRAEPGSMQQRLATMTQNNATLSGQLTTLQAELATERARAEEAERLERVARGVLKRQADELAAANARAARLEEQLAALQQEMGLPRVLASTAPQASTEQAPPSPVEESFCEGLYAGAMGLPAQPAPGGTERWLTVKPELAGCHTPAEPQGHWSDCSDCVRDGGHCKRHPTGPTPVDYVTYEVLIEALRDYDNDGLAKHLLGRLEKARRR